MSSEGDHHSQQHDRHRLAPFALRLFRYKSNGLLLFGRGPRGGGGSWKEAWLSLAEDDTLIWYNDKHCSKINGQIRDFTASSSSSSSSSPSSMSSIRVGRMAEKEARENLNPSRPTWAAADEALYMVVTRTGKKPSEWYWFYLKKDADLLSCLVHFARGAGRETEFRRLIDHYRVEDELEPFVTKYKRFGASMRGDSKSTALREDIGVIWQRFVNSEPVMMEEETSTRTYEEYGRVNPAYSTDIDSMRLSSSEDNDPGQSAVQLDHHHHNHVAPAAASTAARSEEEIVVERFERVVVVRTLEQSDESDLHDVGYFSSRTTTLDSTPVNGNSNCERSDSEVSDTSTYFSTTVSVEVHSSDTVQVGRDEEEP